MLRTHQLFREAASYSSLPIWWRRCCGVKTVAPSRQPVSFSQIALDPNAHRRTTFRISGILSERRAASTPKGNTAFTQAALEPFVIETFGGVAPFPDPDDTYAAAAQAEMIASIERAIGAPLPVFTGPGSFAAIKA